MSVVVRFAPSPTGALHIGGVRTALYNYLLAKRLGGKFILRIEDTDQVRFVEGAEQYIIDSLKWCGIEFDEGTHLGGEHAPYRQSERSELYKKYTQQLVENGQAYLAFDTAEELEAIRNKSEADGVKGWQYGYQTRMGLKNSLALPEEEVKRLLAAGVPHVVRLKVPENEEVSLYDEIREDVTMHTSQIDDKVLMKSDGLPTYHLANIVDDHLMEVTHVIRGEEWLPSAPLHVLLYRAFGWTPPKFAHLPLILRPDGHGKLSKRDGAVFGIPIFPLDWTEKGELLKGFKGSGFLPDALLNFLVLLGWNPGHDEEIMTIERMVELFSLEKVGKAGTRFDVDKLHWFNATYIKAKSNEELLPYLRNALNESDLNGENYTDDYCKMAISLMKERVTFTHELFTHARYLFETPQTYEATFAAEKWTDLAKANVLQIKTLWEGEDEANWNHTDLFANFKTYTKGNKIKNGDILPQLRLALTGTSGGPGVFEIAELIGKKETLHRIEKALAEI